MTGHTPRGTVRGDGLGERGGLGLLLRGSVCGVVTRALWATGAVAKKNIGWRLYMDTWTLKGTWALKCVDSA